MIIELNGQVYMFNSNRDGSPFTKPEGSSTPSTVSLTLRRRLARPIHYLKLWALSILWTKTVTRARQVKFGVAENTRGGLVDQGEEGEESDSRSTSLDRNVRTGVGLHIWGAWWEPGPRQYTFGDLNVVCH